MEIKAVMFDLGETLRIFKHDKRYEDRAALKMTELAGTDMDPQTFTNLLDERYEDYRKWCFETRREANEVELFTKWMLPDFPRDRIEKNAYDLGFWYRQVKGFRVVVEGGIEVIRELHARGYKLGIISNLITTYEVPEWLERDHIAEYFDTVQLSAVCGIRKPDPAIYLLAADAVGVKPEECAYIGDNFDRDVTGSREANFGLNIIYTSPSKFEKQLKTVRKDNCPDGVIFDFSDLMTIFPGYPDVDMTPCRPVEVPNA